MHVRSLACRAAIDPWPQKLNALPLGRGNDSALVKAATKAPPLVAGSSEFQSKEELGIAS